MRRSVKYSSACTSSITTTLPSAGALAKRICNYLQAGQEVKQTEEMGFIKFGSRVDLLLPLDAKVHVKIGDKPQGGVTTIATW